MPTLTLTQSQYLQLTTTGVANYWRRVKVPAANYFEDITPMGQTYFRTADGLLNIIYPHHAIGASVLARERGNKKKSLLCEVSDIQVIRKNSRWYWQYVLVLPQM